MMSTPFLAAAAEATGGAGDGGASVDFETALLLVIVVCLVFMAKAIADLGRRVDQLIAGNNVAPRPVAVGAAPVSTHASQRDGAPSPETIAAITAAVHTVIDQPARIVAVNEITAEQARHWSLEGRRQIFTSHRVR